MRHAALSAGAATYPDDPPRAAHLYQPCPGWRNLAEVKAAAGHASLLTTSVYLHVVVDEREEVGELFGASE